MSSLLSHYRLRTNNIGNRLDESAPGFHTCAALSESRRHSDFYVSSWCLPWTIKVRLTWKRALWMENLNIFLITLVHGKFAHKRQLKLIGIGNWIRRLGWDSLEESNDAIVSYCGVSVLMGLDRITFLGTFGVVFSKGFYLCGFCLLFSGI